MRNFSVSEAFRKAPLLLTSSLVALTVASCSPREEFDISPPRVLSVTPSGPIISVDPVFEVELSELVSEETLTTDTVVFAPLSVVDSGFLSDVGNPPLNDTTLSEIIEVSIEINEERITVTPQVRLEAGVDYALVLSEEIRDLNANGLVDATNTNANVVFNFQTNDGAPQVIATSLPEDPDTVFPNTKRFRVDFNQAVRGVDRDSLTLSSNAGQDPLVDSVIVSADRKSAELVLGDAATCERLSANAVYALSLSADISDDEDNAMEPVSFEFTVGPDCDNERLTIVEQVQGVGGETTATVRFFTNKPSSTEVRFGLMGGFLGCLNQGCPIIGEPGTDAGSGRYFHTVEITGLEIDQVYAFEVRSEDEVGFVATGSGSFLTAELPDVAINEIMANAPASIEENDGEYVEIVNYGASALSLEGWFLLTDGGDAVGGDTCLLEGAGDLEAGAFLVIGGSAFDAESYGVDEGSVLRRTARTVCGALVNSRVQLIELADDEGRIVSTYSSDIIPSREGTSVERIAPDAADESASFCFSRSDTGPTPGAANGVAADGCEE